MKKVLVFLCCFCSLTLVISAQKRPDVLKILEKLNKSACSVQTLSGKLESIYRSPEPETDIIVGKITGNFRFKKVATDTALGWYLMGEFFSHGEKTDGFKVYYNGDSLRWYSLKDASAEVSSPASALSVWGFGDFMENVKTLELWKNRLVLPDSVFERLEDSWLVGEISRGKDTLVEGHKCYVLENYKEGEKPEFKVKYRRYDRLVIDPKLSFLIAHCSHFQRFVNGKPGIDQIVQREMSRLQINKEIPDSVFQFKEKTKIVEPPVRIEWKKGDQMPDFRLPDLKGDTVALYTQKGKLIILNFGYFGCGNCAMLNQEIKREVLDSCDVDKFRYLYINLRDPLETMRAYAKDRKVAYPMLKGDEEMERRYGIIGYPHLFILDENYKILRMVPGYFEGIGKKIREIIHEAE